MKEQKKTTVSHGFRNGFSVNDYMITGKTMRTCGDIVLYDENGPLTTNYTNCNEFEFETLRPISIKAVEAPQWDNPNGFLIEEKYTFRANSIHEKLYILFIHIDNLKPYARELLEYWEMYSVCADDAGTIKNEFSYEGCSFCRIVRNPRMYEAREAVSAVVDQYDHMRWTPINCGLTAVRNSKEAISYCRHIIEALKGFEIVREEVKQYGIVELIHINGANQPIGHNDFYDLLNSFDWMKNTYRLETCPRTPEEVYAH